MVVETSFENQKPRIEMNKTNLYFYYLKMEAVKEYWNRRPCNIKHSNSQFGSKKYFEEVIVAKVSTVESMLNSVNEFFKESIEA